MAMRKANMATTRRRTGALRVLFVGNSFTARNDLTGLIARLAIARGRKMEHRLISAGGASLRRHWNAGEAFQAMQAVRYDFVVLQEQSTLPVKSPARMHESVRLFDEAIRASGAKTVLYMTWARRKAPETQAAITNAYNQIGVELDALVVPVGVAWQKVLSRKGHPVLHDRDDSHPTMAGTYLAACVFLASLVKEDPVDVGDGGAGLNDADQRLLQRAARDAVRQV
jgi:hypothetical protein